MRAGAIVVAGRDGPGLALMQLAQTLDFAAVMPYGGPDLAEQQSRVTPVCFFLFAETGQIEDWREIAEAIRLRGGPNIRYSPLIYFCASPPVETLAACINLGFDDIIAMPCATAGVAARIERQVGRRLAYFETDGYFGPDRRDRAGLRRLRVEARLQAAEFRRVEFVRDLATGTRIMRDDHHLEG